MGTAGGTLSDIITLPTPRLRSFHLEGAPSPLIYFDKEAESLPLDPRILAAGDVWVPSNEEMDSW